MPYKVVEKVTRWGTNWAIFKSLVDRKAFPERYAKGLRFRKKHSEYFPHYHKGRIVKAAPKTVGIMCFPTKTDAERFKERCRCRDRLIIIKVEGIGSARKVGYIIEWCGSYPWSLLTSEPRLAPAPYATVAFPAVKVLE
ncbi:MAG: hypothetical protein J7J52_04790 [Deltaproteobacteria bacterium]|nr:hypothetical protein [Deltaproteobacteria bacterium]